MSRDTMEAMGDVLALLAAGATRDEILADYRYL